MDMFRAFLAIVLSFLILVGYQYFFVKSAPPPQDKPTTAAVTTAGGEGQTPVPAPLPAQVAAQPAVQNIAVDPSARDIVVETPLYKVEKGKGGAYMAKRPSKRVATSLLILGLPSRQNRLANATAIVPRPPCVRAASPHHRTLGAGYAALPQMAGRR